ncbi:ribonuclease H [Malassezia sp. CBS 17886]|nr:ribonuclease H [Malassezia sp. CBS 17886]
MGSVGDVPSVRPSALTGSYTWSSPVPRACVGDGAAPTGVPCVLGVDEAGRGPVLGPLVYGVAYCPEESMDTLGAVGFADSKALTAERRDALLQAMHQHAGVMGWAVRVIAPQDISADMLKRHPHNLNAQSTDATVALIQHVLDAGIDVTKIYVDTVGDPGTYSKTLRSYFPAYPHIAWTVTRKADAIYPIVGAASIAAKVTRDRCLETWVYAERLLPLQDTDDADAKRRRTDSVVDDARSSLWDPGSGYPGDPRTVRYLQHTLDPVFGWAGIVRFSWATAKTMLEERVGRQPAARTRSARSTDAAANGAPTRTCLGTLCPTGPRAYAVRWMDEPATLTDFFVKPKVVVKKAPVAPGKEAGGRAPLVASTTLHADRDRDALRKQTHAMRRDLSLFSSTAADFFEETQ